MSQSIAVTIATHNRKTDLVRTCAALAKLDPPPDEIIICADGCRDGTAEFIQQKYPSYRLLINETARGSIASRNRMMRECTSEIALSLDDDSYPIEPDFIARLRALFVQYPRLAVATFPQRSDEFPESLEQTDFGVARFIGTFSNSGAAIRTEVFRELGGYPKSFHHAYEEPDLAIRCLEAGCQVWFEPSLTIRHHYTAMQRSELRTHHFHARNEMWSAIMRCPAPQVFPIVAFRAARQFQYAGQRGMRWIIREPIWWWKFLVGLPATIANRKPIPWRIYRNWMSLIRTPILSENEWHQKFGSVGGKK